MKKIIAYILTAAFILQSAVIAAADSGVGINESVDLLEGMGIYTQDDEMREFDEPLTRAKMAAMLSVFYGGVRDGSVRNFEGKSVYSDVDEDYYLAYEIMLLAQKGCMSGFTDGTFHPENNVTFSQAIKAVVTVLGYGTMAEYAGGWSAGYMQKADETGITKGISADGGDEITRAQFTKLLMNALDTKTVSIKIAGGGNVEYAESDKLMNRMGYYKIKGIVTATKTLGLFGEKPLRDDQILIGDTILDVNKNYDGYIGMYVTGYYRKTRDMDYGKAVYIETSDKNESIIVPADKIQEGTNTNDFVYEDATGRIKVAQIPSDVTFIFNGRRLTFFNKEHIKPIKGSVQLIDADADSTYETIVVKSYIDYWVNGIYEKDGVITISDALGNPPVVIDTNDSDTVLNIIKDGSETTYTDIKQKNVISIAADNMSGNPIRIDSESENYDIVISDKMISGAMKGIDYEEYTVNIDGTEYNISHGFDFEEFNLMMGKTYNYYFNADEELVAVKEVSADSYCFIIKAYIDDDDDDLRFIKAYTSGGDFVRYKIADNVKIDDKVYKDSEQIINALEKSGEAFFEQVGLVFKNKSGMEQLVKYKVNTDDEIISMDTVAENESGDKGFNFAAEMSGSPLYSFQGSRIFSSGYATTDDMITFLVPSDLTDESSFKILSNALTYSDKISFSVYAFDSDDMNVIRCCLMNVTQDDKVEIKESENLMVVSKVTTKVNADDLEVTYFDGVKLLSGLNYSLEIADNVKNVSKIKPGCVVRWTADGYGRAIVVEPTYSPYDEDWEDSSWLINKKEYGTSFFSDFRLAAGTVEDMDEKYMMVKFDNNGADKTETYLTSGVTNVIVFNKDEKNNTYHGSLNSVKSRKHFGTAANKVFMYQWYAAPRTLVLYE